MAVGDLTTLDAVKGAVGVRDQGDDPWFMTAIAAVSSAIEAVTGRWMAPRPSSTYYFDSEDCNSGGDVLFVPMGLDSLSYIGISWTDQPADGSGVYTPVPLTAAYLDPPVQSRNEQTDPAWQVTLGRLAGVWFPPDGSRVRRAVKVTGVWGYQTVPPRAEQIARTAVVRAWRAKSSGAADYAVIGPDGGMKILRDLAPAELAELRMTWADPVVG